MSWYRLYRPQTVSGLHSAATRSAMESILRSGKFSYAYLMVGPRGTGKTTSARILARLLNCERNRTLVEGRVRGELVRGAFEEPCGTCVACTAIAAGNSMCVTEIDAASQTGIDNIRALQEMLMLTAADGPVRVCIFDEVHMLSKSSFNALLKVLEEPPRHVVFVLATTNPEKVPPTVVSRCQQLQSRMATLEELTTALQGVADAERITVERDVLQRIAERADGSFRDAVKLFEQACWGKTSLNMAELEAGAVGLTQDWTARLLTALRQKDAISTGNSLRDIRDSGVSMSEVQRGVLQSLRAEAVRGEDRGALAMLKQLNQPINANLPFPELPFEIACMEWCLGAAAPPAAPAAPASPAVKTSSNVAIGVRAGAVSRTSVESALHTPKVESVSDAPVRGESVASHLNKKEGQASSEMFISADGNDSSPLNVLTAQERWGAILTAVGKKTMSLNSVLKTAQPVSAEQQTLTIEVSFPFHKDKLQEEKHLRLLEMAVREVCGWPTARIALVVGKTPVRKFGVTAGSSSSGESASAGDSALADAVAGALL